MTPAESAAAQCDGHAEPEPVPMLCAVDTLDERLALLEAKYVRDGLTRPEDHEMMGLRLDHAHRLWEARMTPVVRAEEAERKAARAKALVAARAVVGICCINPLGCVAGDPCVNRGRCHE
jgi:hypothetical protein